MKTAFERFQKYNGVTHEAKIQGNIGTTQLYPELFDADTFKPLPEALEIGAVELTKASDTFNDVWVRMQPQLEDVIAKKREAPHETIAGLDNSMLRSAEEVLVAAVNQYNSAVQKINDEFSAFKRTIDIDKLTNNINSHNVEMNVLSLKKRRLQMNTACEEHKMLFTQILELDKQVKDNQQKLSQQQSEFLGKFFEKINYYFVKFGSKDFSISTEPVLDAKGHQPVISLIVKFKDKTIPSAQLVRVFSESDRRALALSIFWARLTIMEDVEKKKATQT
jgi:hypothetical protein